MKGLAWVRLAQTHQIQEDSFRRSKVKHRNAQNPFPDVPKIHLGPIYFCRKISPKIT